MPGWKKYAKKYSKRRATTKPKTYRRKYSKSTVRKNTRAIKQLNKNQYKLVQYKAEFESPHSTLEPQVYKIINPHLWQDVFASNSTNEDGDRYFNNSINIKMNVQQPAVQDVGTTVPPVYYSIFFVSLKKEFAKNTQLRTSGLQTMTPDLDYTTVVLSSTVAGAPTILGNAQWRLNPVIYKTHAIRRGVVSRYAHQGNVGTGVNATASSNFRDANKNHNVNIPWRRRLQQGVGVDIHGTETSWKDMTSEEIEPHDQLYMITFTSGSILVSDPAGANSITISTSIQYNGKVPV